MSEFKIYYGEYTLKHWIQLILRREIILPDYQRSFVWKEQNVVSLIASLKNNSFVPPVVIAGYFENNRWNHFILDGQQRLTSLLLAYINRFPKSESFKTEDISEESFGDDNDDVLDPQQEYLAWTFERITSLDSISVSDKTTITTQLDDKQYKTFMPPGPNGGLDIASLGNDFFETTCLGFSFIKPSSKDSVQQTRYYSNVFRSINTTAWSLDNLESRRSLYWLDKNIAPFFEFPAFKKMRLVNGRVDFVRYIALLSEYHKLKNNEKHKKLADKFSGRGRNINKTIETYIDSYIYHVVGEKPSERFIAFEEIFPNRAYQDKVEKLQGLIRTLEIPNTFSSIIDADYFLFGLIFYTLFEAKTIDATPPSILTQKIQDGIAKAKKEASHVKQPSALVHLNKRVRDSIRIFSEFAK